MSNTTGAKIIAFFGLAEAIATAIAFIPLFIKFFEFRGTPTDIGKLVDFFEMIPWFLFGQIPGMIISAIVTGIFGDKKEG